MSEEDWNEWRQRRPPEPSGAWGDAYQTAWNNQANQGGEAEGRSNVTGGGSPQGPPAQSAEDPRPTPPGGAESVPSAQEVARERAMRQKNAHLAKQERAKAKGKSQATSIAGTDGLDYAPQAASAPTTTPPVALCDGSGTPASLETQPQSAEAATEAHATPSAVASGGSGNPASLRPAGEGPGATPPANGPNADNNTAKAPPQARSKSSHPPPGAPRPNDLAPQPPPPPAGYAGVFPSNEPRPNELAPTGRRRRAGDW